MSDPGLLYAPVFRLTTAASVVWTTWVFGVALVALVLVSLLFAWRAWSHALQLRGEVWRHKGLRPGALLVGGVAEPVDEESEAARREAAAFSPFVELTIHQHGEQRSSRNGRYVLWKETTRTLTERPFILRTDAGMRVRVEPSGHIELVDKLEAPIRNGNDRLRIAKIVPGERIWVRGDLLVGSAQGPYRGTADQPTLRPPSDRPMLICSQPIEAEDLGTARFHAGFALGFVVVLLFCQGVLFSTFRTLRYGVEQSARITDVRHWVTRNKNAVTNHYGFTVAPMNVQEEVSYDAYASHRVGDAIPVMRGATNPSLLQIGPASEVGETTGHVTFASFLTIGVVGAWLAVSASRRPWWRRKRYDETQPGTL